MEFFIQRLVVEKQAAPASRPVALTGPQAAETSP